MSAWNLNHLPFNRGWRWKITQTQTDETIDAGETKVLQELNLNNVEVESEFPIIAGWIMYSTVTSTTRDLAAGTRTQPPGPKGQYQTAARTAGDLLDTGATSPQGGFVWAQKTTVGGTDLFTQFFNGFGGTPSTVRFPELSEIFVRNDANTQETIKGYEIETILVHKPMRFFRDMIAYNMLTGNIHPDLMGKSPEEILDMMNAKELITAIAEPQ